MKTDQLIDRLVEAATPVRRDIVSRRLATAALAGTLCATALMLVLLGLRPDITAVVPHTAFWAKLAYPVAIALGSAWLLVRLGRPGAGVGRVGLLAALPVAAIWLLGLATLADAQPGDRLALLQGGSWHSCALYIAALAVPPLAANFWAVGAMAPTRLAWAGAAAGALAGALGACAYAWHCTEMAAPFLAVWYTLGMAIPAAVGAVAGPRFLRW
jgi:hypothetical protein